MYLDYHGQMRDLTRRDAQKAIGAMRIVLAEAQPVDLTFTAGMRLLAANDLEFTLDQSFVIASGLTHYTAAVTAEQTGPDGNLPAMTRLMFMSGPACVQSVSAVQSFTGGTDAESDEAFRERILQSFRPGSNGVNAEYYRAMALSVPGIVACSVIGCARGALTIDIVAADESGMPTQEQLAEITQLVQDRTEIGIDLQVLAPTEVPLNVEVQLRCVDGVPFDDAKIAAQQLVRQYFTGRLLGTQIYASALSHRIFATGMVKDCVVTLSGLVGDIGPEELPTLNSLLITEAVS